MCLPVQMNDDKIFVILVFISFKVDENGFVSGLIVDVSQQPSSVL